MDKSRLLQAIAGGCVDPWAATVHWFSKPSPPPPPDYAGAAREQGAANVEAARVQGRLNRPDEYAPTGSRVWSDLGDDRFRVDTTLSPEQQALYNQDVATRQQLGGLAGTAATNAQGVLNSPVDLSGIPGMPGSGMDTRKAVSEALMSRLEPQFARDWDTKRSDMVTRGFREGDEAWQREADQFERAKTDARIQADLAAGAESQRDFGMGMDTRRQAITESMLNRQTPLNEIAALMSGSQVQSPSFQPYYGVQNIAPPPIFGATQAAGQYGTDVYNAQVGGQNALLGGLGSIGASALAFKPWFL
jgi:hypothetical protein